MSKHSEFFKDLSALTNDFQQNITTKVKEELDDYDNDSSSIQSELDTQGTAIAIANNIIGNCVYYQQFDDSLETLFDLKFAGLLTDLGELKDSDQLQIQQYLKKVDELYSKYVRSVKTYDTDEDEEKFIESKSESATEEKDASRRNSITQYHLFGNSQSLLRTENKTKLSKLKDDTDKFILQANKKLKALETEIDNVTDNDQRFTALMNVTLLQDSIEKAVIIQQRCQKLLALKNIEGVEPIQFYNGDTELKNAIDALHSNLKDLSTKVDKVSYIASFYSSPFSDISTLLKTFLDSLAANIPGLPMALSPNESVTFTSSTPTYKSSFVILNVQTDNFVNDLSEQVKQVQMEIAAMNEKTSSTLLGNKKTKLNMLENGISQGKIISNICATINNDIHTISELTTLMEKINEPLENLKTIENTINIVVSKEPVTWTSAWFKAPNPGISIANFVKSVEATVKRTKESLPKAVFEEEKSSSSRPNQHI